MTDINETVPGGRYIGENGTTHNAHGENIDADGNPIRIFIPPPPRSHYRKLARRRRRARRAVLNAEARAGDSTYTVKDLLRIRWDD